MLDEHKKLSNKEIKEEKVMRKKSKSRDMAFEVS